MSWLVSLLISLAVGAVNYVAAPYVHCDKKESVNEKAPQDGPKPIEASLQENGTLNSQKESCTETDTRRL